MFLPYSHHLSHYNWIDIFNKEKTNINHSWNSKGSAEGENNCLQAHFPFLSGGEAPLRQWIYANGNNNTASKAHFSLIARESPVSLESSIETACTCTAWAKNQRFSWMIKKGKPFQLWIINWLHIRTYHCSLAHAAYCKLSLSYLHSIVYHLTALQFPLHSPNPLARKLNARLFCHCGPECPEKPRPLVTFESRRVGAWSSPDEAVSKEKKHRKPYSVEK